jgi:hypothetical protein
LQATIGDEYACRSAIAKRVSKLGAVALKAQARCVKDVLKGNQALASGEKCHQMSTADTAGKVANTAAAFQDAVGPAGGKCSEADDPISLAGFQANCQVGVAGAPLAITDYDDVSDCLVSAAQGAAELVFGEILSPDYPAIAASLSADDLGSCANAIAKYSAKAVKTILKERVKAQNALDHVSAATAASYGQFAVANTKITDALANLSAAIDDKCTAVGSDLLLLGSCDRSATLVGTKACVAAAISATVEGLASMAYVNRNEFPVRADLVVNAGTTTAGIGSALDGITGARVNRGLDQLGFTGLNHFQDMSGGFPAAVALDCGGDGVCDIEASCAKNNCRCANDVTAACDEPFAADANDCAGNLCRVFYGPPHSRSGSGTPYCVVIEVDSLQGSVDLGNGSTVSTLETSRQVYLDDDGQNRPCPRCDRDPTANDAIAGGTCSGGDRDGLACDANGFSPTFGSTSYDCPPVPGKAVGLPLAITMGISDQPQDLTASVSCGGALPGELCHCRACSGDPAVGCSSDLDCSSIAAGTCTSNGTGVPQVLPNGCANGGFTCPSDGTCDDPGDSTTFCDGFVRADGRGIYPCISNADCMAIAGECPGNDCGSCTLSEQLPCFLDTMNASGMTRAGIAHADLGANYCIPPNDNPGVNAAGGLPGPGRSVLDLDLTLLCSDGVTAAVYGGFNCP